MDTLHPITYHTVLSFYRAGHLVYNYTTVDTAQMVVPFFRDNRQIDTLDTLTSSPAWWCIYRGRHGMGAYVHECPYGRPVLLALVNNILD